MPYTNLFYSFSLPPHTSTENMEILLYGDVSNSRIEFSLCFSFLLAFSCADKCKFRVPTRKYVGSLWRFEYRCWLSYETGFSYQNIHKKVFNGYDLFMLWKIGIYTITWTYWWWQVSKLFELRESNWVAFTFQKRSERKFKDNLEGTKRSFEAIKLVIPTTKQPNQNRFSTFRGALMNWV